MRRLFAPSLLLSSIVASVPASADPPKLPNGLPLYAHPSSLGAVAKKFRLRVDEIAELNLIRDPARFNRRAVVLPLTPLTAKLPRYRAWVPAPARKLCAETITLAPKKRAGCDSAFCAVGPNEEKICTCVRGEHRVALRIEDGRGAPWEIELGPSIHRSPGPGTFELAQADLYGDGHPEILVSWIESESNGIAERARTLVVLDGGKELLRYDSGAFAAPEAATAVAGECHLSSAHFEEVVDPIRPSALHLVERSFDPIRFRTDPTLVGKRISDETRFVLPEEPLVVGKARRVGTTIAGLALGDDEAPASFSLRDGAGTRKRPAHTCQLGDATSGRLFPPNLLSPRLLGLHAERIGKTQDERTILWLTR